MSYAEYASWQAARSSVLSAAEKSAAHLRLAELRVEDDPTKSTELGVGVHCAILEPALFEARYTRGLRRPRKSNADTAAHAAFELENATLGREVIADGQYEKCLRIRDALLRKPWRASLLDGPGVVELSVLWTDAQSGVRCKARVDRLALNYLAPGWREPAPAICELKTCAEVTEAGFHRSIQRYSYQLQARMQLEAIAAHDPSWIDPGTIEPRPEQYVWLVLETAEPWESRLFVPSTDTLSDGAKRLRHALALWSECQRTGQWPGFPPEPQPIDLKPWARFAPEPSAFSRPERHSGEPRTRHTERHALVPKPQRGDDDELF